MLIFFESVLNFVFVCLSVKSVIELYEGGETSSLNQVLNIISLFIVPCMMMGILSINLSLLIFATYSVSIFNADMFNDKTERTLKTLIHNVLFSISYILIFFGIMTDSIIIQLFTLQIFISPDDIYEYFFMENTIKIESFYITYQTWMRSLGLLYLLECFRIYLPHSLMCFVTYFLFQNIIPLGLVPTLIFSLLVSSGVLFTIPTMTSSQFNVLYLNFLNLGALLFLVLMPIPMFLKVFNIFSSLISTLGTYAKNQTLKVVRYIYDHVKMTYYISKNEKMDDKDALRYSTIIDLKLHNRLTEDQINELELEKHSEYFQKMEFNIESLKVLKSNEKQNYQDRLGQLTDKNRLLVDLKNILQDSKHQDLIFALVAEENDRQKTYNLFQNNLKKIESFVFAEDLLPHLSSTLIDYHANMSHDQTLMKLIEIARSIFVCNQGSAQMAKMLVQDRDSYTQWVEKSQNECRLILNQYSAGYASTNLWCHPWRDIQNMLTESNSYHSNLQKEIFINPDSDLGDHSALNRDGFTMIILFYSLVFYPIHNKLLDKYYTKDEYNMLVAQFFELEESERNNVLESYLYPLLKDNNNDGVNPREFVSKHISAETIQNLFNAPDCYFNDQKQFKIFYKQLMYSTGRIVDLNLELENLSTSYKVIFGYLLFPILYDLCYLYHGEFVIPRIDLVIRELLWYSFYCSLMANSFYLGVSIFTLLIQCTYEILTQLMTLALSMLYQPFFAINQCAKHTYYLFTNDQSNIDKQMNESVHSI